MLRYLYAILPFVVFVCAALPFSAAVGFGLVNCDDFLYVRSQAWMASGLSVASLYRAVLCTADNIWMPLTRISYLIDYTLGGGSAAALHLHSILLHGVNAVLVYWFLLDVTAGEAGDRRRAWVNLSCCAGALLWALHPLRCESVAWVASRKDVLSFFWELLALRFWLKSSRASGGRWKHDYAASLLFFLCGLMSKPSAMTFPVLAAVVDVFLFHRFYWRRLALPFAVAVAFAFNTTWLQGRFGASESLASVPLWGRLLNASAAFGLYLRNTVWPDMLAPQCLHRWPGFPRFMWPGLVLSFFCLVYVAVILLHVRKNWSTLNRDGEERVRNSPADVRTGYAPAGIFWFALGVFPFLGIARFGYHAFADRFTYVPAVGISILVTGLLASQRRRRMTVACLACMIVAALGCRAAWQTRIWENDFTLWTHTLKVDGDKNDMAHTLLGAWHYEFSHDLERAVDEFRKGWQLNPSRAGDYGQFYILALCERGLYAEASDRINWYAEWTEDFLAKARKYAPPATAMRLPRHAAGMIPFRAVKDVYFATQPGLDRIGIEDLDSMLADHPEDPTLLYARGAAAGFTNDETARDSFWLRLVASPKREPYMRFRFVEPRLKSEKRKVDEK